MSPLVVAIAAIAVFLVCPSFSLSHAVLAEECAGSDHCTPDESSQFRVQAKPEEDDEEKAKEEDEEGKKKQKHKRAHEKDEDETEDEDKGEEEAEEEYKAEDEDKNEEEEANHAEDEEEDQDELKGEHEKLKGEHEKLKGEYEKLKGEHDKLQGDHKELQGDKVQDFDGHWRLPDRRNVIEIRGQQVLNPNMVDRFKWKFAGWSFQDLGDGLGKLTGSGRLVYCSLYDDLNTIQLSEPKTSADIQWSDEKWTRVVATSKGWVEP